MTQYPRTPRLKRGDRLQNLWVKEETQPHGFFISRHAELTTAITMRKESAYSKKISASVGTETPRVPQPPMPQPLESKAHFMPRDVPHPTTSRDDGAATVTLGEGASALARAS